MPGPDDFASAVAASQQIQEEAAPSDDGGLEAAGVDPVAQLAKMLSEQGVTPDKALDFTRKFEYIQTPEGQQAYWDAYIKSEAGNRIKAQLGQEYMADFLAKDPNSMYKMALQFGAKPEGGSVSDDEDLTPTERDVRAMKAQQAALQEQINRLNQQGDARIRQLESTLQGNAENQARVAAFNDWKRTVPAMANQAQAAVAKRAWELSVLDPDKYRGQIGFKRAAADAYSELTSVSTYFQPRRPPRAGGPGSGGGVAAGQATGKLSLKEMIERASDQFARDSRGEE